MRAVVSFIGALFLGVFLGILADKQELFGQGQIYQWLPLALAVLLFIAAAFVGRPVKKESSQA
jgi:F0F1-type ATP synthase assembly protein I